MLLGLAQWLDKSDNKKWENIVFVCVAILAATYPLGIFQENSLDWPLFFPLYYGFLLGIFAYWCSQGKLKSIYFYLYAAILLAGGVAKSSGFTINCVIVSTILLEVGRANRIQDVLNWQPLQFLGRISYSLYLTHNIVINGVLFLGFKLLKVNILVELICFCVAILASLGFAAIMYELAEKPSIKLSRKVKLVKNPETITV